MKASSQRLSAVRAALQRSLSSLLGPERLGKLAIKFCVPNYLTDCTVCEVIQVNIFYCMAWCFCEPQHNGSELSLYEPQPDSEEQMQAALLPHAQIP